MPSNFDIPISLPRGYSTENTSKTNSERVIKKSQQIIEPSEIPENLNKLRRKIIRGVIKHDSPSDR